MRKERWKHYRKERSYVQGDKAVCGKKHHGWKNTVFVHVKEETTCPRCIEKISIEEIKNNLYG